jgi:hypothetical protein
MKTKDKIRGATPVEFYSTLHFEECLFRLRNDADKVLKVDLQEQSEDHARFLVTLREEPHGSANMTGTLQKWDEATRIEALIFPRPFSSHLKLWGIIALIVLTLGGFLTIFLVMSEKVRDPGATGLNSLAGCVGIVLLIAGVAFLHLSLSRFAHRSVLVGRLQDLLTDKRKKAKG